MLARQSAIRLTALLLAGATFASPALGQEAGGLEDIIVTAQKRAENLQRRLSPSRRSPRLRLRRKASPT